MNKSNLESMIRENCIRCGKRLPKVNDWLCEECKEHINSIDKTFKRFHTLTDKEREDIINMSTVEFLDYCKKDVLELTNEEYKVYSVKAFNETIEKPIEGYNCSICNNKLYVQDLIWNSEKKIFVVDHRECECRKVRKSLQLMKKSGLERTIRDYTFDNFTTKEKWQKEIKDKALDFVDNGSKQEKWFMLSGNSGCVDSETEYFNGKKWVKIAQYKKGDKVLQYTHIDKGVGKAKLVAPLRYIKEKEEYMFLLNNKRGSVNQMLSIDHDFAYITSKGNINKKNVGDLIEQHKSTKYGFRGQIITAFNYSGKGIELNEHQIRLMVAVIADGSFRKNQRKCFVNIKKQRKKDRLEMLLKNANIEYKKWKKPDGYHCYYFYAPRKEKIYSEYWYDCNQKQLNIIADEVIYWDGSIDKKGRKHFYTTIKESADFIQFAFSSTMRYSSICIDNRENKPMTYMVSCCKAYKTSMIKNEIKKVKSTDGYKYCFTVPSGFLVLRRNNRIFVTGNCGKSHCCTAIVRELLYKVIPCRYMVWDSEITELNAKVNDPIFATRMNELKKIDVLYIDDLFKPVSLNIKPTQGELKRAKDLIDYRYRNKLTTIISTEISIEDICAIDEAIGGRIYEMCKDYYIHINGKDKNYRLR